MKTHSAFKLFETILLIGIITTLSVVLLLAFIDITHVIYRKIMAPPLLVVDAQGLMELFSLILILLIGLELIETVKAYLDEGAVHVELVLLVAIIAIARKVVVWDFDKHSEAELYSLAAMVLALAVSYFLVKHNSLKLPNLFRETKED